MAAIEENVLVQIENLRTHPSVAAALSRGDLRLHGWVYKFQTGEVFAYHADQQQYLPLSDQPTEVLAGAASQWPAI
jgi:carbonic anhydrase